MAGKWYEELEPGLRIAHDIRRTVTETDNLLVSTLTHNPAALHLDAEAGRASPYGQVLVNSVFTLGLMTGVSVGDTTLGTTVANLGWDEVRFPKPVFVGDTLRCETEVVERRESRSRPDQGIVVFRHTATNQRGERVATCLRSALMFKRPAAQGLSPVRCLLFVPGDSERKLARSADSPADALILDLEDSVGPERKAAARSLVRERLDAPRGPQALWVRINALDTPEHLHDLAAVVGARPLGIMLPKACGAGDVRRLDACLAALEAREGVEIGAIRVLVVATETGASMFGLGSYTPATPRLAGLTWGAEDLSADVGAASNSDDTGAHTPLYVLARSLCLAAAAAAQTTAVDGVHTRIGDDEGLARACREARRDGFTAKLAIHPAQVPVILGSFAPTPAELERARAVVAAFAAGEGVARLDGRMLDIPHLKQARRLLAAAGG